jgi:benzoyl-CoA reductase/2-hydroxyglutaryl-CoA dehydratase subunit BcrC/BadD/HgdB
MDVFFDAATQIRNEPILQWKEAGKQVIGYTCSYVPAEIFYAADILPVRLRGIETDGMDIADAYYGPFICSYPKCILQLAGKGMFDFLDGAVITPGCDAMRRLDECWRKAGEDHASIAPPYVYYFDVPHKTEPHGMNWFVQEIRNLIQSVAQHFDVQITVEKLKTAIREYNKGRRLLQEVEELRTGAGVTVSGTEVFAATVAGTVMPRDTFGEHLESWLQSLRRNRAANNGRKRLMLIGSISDEIDLVALIEKNFDAVVVAENLCFGVRYEGNQIPEDEDPIRALAEHYLGKSVCPRMYGQYKERLALLKQKIEHAGVDGVVMQNIRFCDLHGAENALFERDLEAAGVPCLRIEREYGPLTETGRMKLRINAFMERIS